MIRYKRAMLYQEQGHKPNSLSVSAKANLSKKKLGQKKDLRFKTRDYLRFAWNMKNISLILKLILDY